MISLFLKPVSPLVVLTSGIPLSARAFWSPSSLVFCFFWALCHLSSPICLIASFPFLSLSLFKPTSFSCPLMCVFPLGLYFLYLRVAVLSCLLPCCRVQVCAPAHTALWISIFPCLTLLIPQMSYCYSKPSRSMRKIHQVPSKSAPALNFSISAVATTIF